MLTVYGAEWCKFCKKTKDLLDSKYIEYIFIDIDEKVEESEVLIEKGLKTIPQIFEGGNLVGGYSDLVESYLE